MTLVVDPLAQACVQLAVGDAVDVGARFVHTHHLARDFSAPAISAEPRGAGRNRGLAFGSDPTAVTGAQAASSGVVAMIPTRSRNVAN